MSLFSVLPASPQDRTGVIDRDGAVCNLFLIAKRRQGHLDDFRQIASLIRQQTREVLPYVMADRIWNSARPSMVWRPSLVVSPLQLKRLRPVRGALCENRFLPKSEEYRKLEAAGIPVPKWALLSPSVSPDLSDFNEYVVQKPDCGGRGAEVRIKRRTRVRWKPPTNSRALSSGVCNLVIQEFIYTGRWPSSYRVTTWFGQPLFAWKVTASKSRRPLAERYGFRNGQSGGGISICSSGSGCTFDLCYESDVLELAGRAHREFPDYPILGCDIVRDADDGQLYVIETNSCGHLWHFSSAIGRGIQHDNGIDFKSQFNGLQRAADVLVEETLQRAA